MGVLIEKPVEITVADWRRLAAESRTVAVQWAFGESDRFGAGNRLLKAAEHLRAARTFDGHANMLELVGETDKATVEIWDLTDEGVDA